MTSSMFYPRRIRVSQFADHYWLTIETDDGREALYIHFDEGMTQAEVGGFGLALVRAAAKPGEWVEL